MGQNVFFGICFPKKMRPMPNAPLQRTEKAAQLKSAVKQAGWELVHSWK
jgi:hypothetical protein